MRAVIERWVPRAMVCLGLGVLSTVLVAWGLAAWLPHRGLTSQYQMKFGPASDPRPTAVIVQRFIRSGMERRVWRTVKNGSAGGLQLDRDLRTGVIAVDNQ